MKHFYRDKYDTRTHADTMKLLHKLYQHDPALEYATDAMNDAQDQSAPDDTEGSEDMG